MKEKHWLALVAVLLVVGGVEVYLWQQDGKQAASVPAGSFNPLDYYPHLEPGETAPAFEGELLNGGRERVEYPEGGRPTLLFVMSLTCGTCAKTIPSWNRIAEETGGRARALGVVIGSYQREQELLKDKRLTFPALRFPDDKTQQRYKVTKVPQTLLISPGGKVERAIVGQLTEEQVRDLIARAAGG